MFSRSLRFVSTGMRFVRAAVGNGGTMSWGAVRRAVACAAAVAVPVVGMTAAPAGAGVDRPVGPRVAAQAPGGPDPASLGWEAVFEDEFETLDDSRWVVGNDNPAEQAGVRVDHDHAGEASDGFLTLTTYTDAAGRHISGGIETDRNDQLPHGYFNAAYGYLEARIKFENESGTTSDFWTLSAPGNRSFGDPGESGPETGFEHTNKDDLDGDGECDVNEECNTQPVGILGWDGYEEDRHSVGPRASNPNPGGTPLLQGNFHTYGLLWSPDGWRYFIDGYEVFHTTEGLTYRPEFLLLTHQIHDNDWGGPVPAGGYGDIGESTNRTFVDYVRVWQRGVSDVPDQVIGANSAVAVPFTVTDHFYGSPAIDEPESVRVTATSSDQSLVPDANIVVTGNGPAEPDGSLTPASRSFDSGDGWTLTANASVSPAGALTPPGALHLPAAGGSASRAITDLQPNTTYTLGRWADLRIDWTDTDGDGRIDWDDANKNALYDDGETGETLTDANARFDWGVVDVDASRPGDQGVKLVSERPSWKVEQNRWINDYLTFTTGPATTSVTVFFSNTAYASPDAWDSDVTVDDLYLRPVVNPERTVTVRPADGAAGQATITLTARDESNAVVGTDDFTVTVGESSFTNGGFEALPEGSGWRLLEGDPGAGLGADVVVDDPFTLDRVLQLAQGEIDDPRPGFPDYPGTIGTATQPVTGLLPNTSYTLEVTGKGNVGFSYFGYAGTDPCAVAGSCSITGSDWSTKTVTFTTDGSGTGAINLADWVVGDGPSFVDDVRLHPTPAATPAAAAAPALTALGEQRLVSSAPAVVRFSAPPGTLGTVTSDNQALLPDVNLGLGGTGDQRMLSLTPVRDRTGTATVTVHFTNPDGSPGSHALPVTVSDVRVQSPGFEGETNSWSLTTGAAVVGGGAQRTGAGALEVQGSGSATQRLVGRTPTGENGELDATRTYVVGGWGHGGARLTAQEVITHKNASGAWVTERIVLGTVDFPGSTWTYGQAVVETLPKVCPLCGGEKSRIELVVTDPGAGDGAGYVDDVALMHGPAVSPIRDLSLYAGQTRTDWESRTAARVGRVPVGAFWDDAVVDITSSDEAVVPLANIRPEADPRWPMTWSLLVTAPGTATGTSDVTLRLTDPHTGAATERTFTVSVSSGRFNNGSFERDLAGWKRLWWPDAGVVPLRSSASPADHDTVLEVNHGVTTFRVTDLVAGDYLLRGRTFGSGSVEEGVAKPTKVTVRQAEFWQPGSSVQFTTSPLVVDAADGWESFEVPFTVPSGVTEAWISIEDFGSNDGDDPPGDPCVTYKPGRSCFDDLYIVPAP